MLVAKNEKTYNNFSLSLYKRSFRKAHPCRAEIEITSYCNLNCVHCYFPENYPKKYAPTKRLIALLKEMRSQGCLWLGFTGGEPLMHKDFLKIYSQAKKLGFLTSIITNGTLFSKEIVKYLKKYPPFLINLTLNGITKNTYESITRTRHSFTKVMDAIELIVKNKLPLKIQSNIMTLNIAEIDKIELFAQKKHIGYRASAHIYAKLNGDCSPLSLRVRPEQLEQFLKIEIPLKRTADRPKVSYLRCAAGVTDFFIDANLDLFYCSLIREPRFDLKENSLKDALRLLYPRMRTRLLKESERCRMCPYYTICVWCPGQAKLETGSFGKSISDYCRALNKKHCYADCI
jgi:radical SAM protein with 4Fe4S-binding SPASM domain